MTELIWEGKYDGQGKKQGPVRIALPFQTIETVNESAQERQHTLELFSAGREPEWRNRLIWGDKKYVLPSLLPEFAGKVNLIYIDPPFDTGQNFSTTAQIPAFPSDEDEETRFVKEASIIEQKAYRDTWGVSEEDRRRGVSQLDRYLKWFYETVSLLQELLVDGGAIYIHLDWHVGHYAKAVADEVFGPDFFVLKSFGKEPPAIPTLHLTVQFTTRSSFMHGKDRSETKSCKSTIPNTSSPTTGTRIPMVADSCPPISLAQEPARREPSATGDR